MALAACSAPSREAAMSAVIRYCELGYDGIYIFPRFGQTIDDLQRVGRLLREEIERYVKGRKRQMTREYEVWAIIQTTSDKIEDIEKSVGYYITLSPIVKEVVEISVRERKEERPQLNELEVNAFIERMKKS